jgi:hypothetical protein
MEEALGIVVRVSVSTFSTIPALIAVSIQVLTLTLPVPSPLWATVMVLSTMVVVVFCGKVYVTAYSFSAPPLMET